MQIARDKKGKGRGGEGMKFGSNISVINQAVYVSKAVFLPKRTAENFKSEGRKFVNLKKVLKTFTLQRRIKKHVDSQESLMGICDFNAKFSLPRFTNDGILKKKHPVVKASNSTRRREKISQTEFIIRKE